MSKEKVELEVEQMLKMELIDRPKRVSRFDIPDEEIEELARSIKERGLLQSIRVSEKDGRYEIVFGDRRYLAHEKLGLTEIRAVIKEYNARDVALDRVTENSQRKNLSPIEEASEYVNLVEAHNMEYEEIGKMLGITGGVVKRRVLLLSCSEDIQRALHNGKICIGVAEELMRCPDGTHKEYLLEMCVEHGVTVALARKWVNDRLDEIRREESDVERGGGSLGAPGTNPTYVACQLCKEPMEISSAQTIRPCPTCFLTIVENLLKKE